MSDMKVIGTFVKTVSCFRGNSSPASWFGGEPQAVCCFTFAVVTGVRHVVVLRSSRLLTAWLPLAIDGAGVADALLRFVCWSVHPIGVFP